ncbi:hypothetical protein AB1L30_01970 [Bremerella sp. JC817]|uniref:hypothetical protein n=1 Tax=Bremerella sp. JC817 TaxID=3231756 RepID=UPI00345B2148
MRSLVTASVLLLLFVGCQNRQSQVNPFAVYGPQRLPPPGTQTYGQPAQTAPYYQGPAANTAPTLNGGYPQQNAPAQFSPPANTYPAPTGPSSYQQGQWQSVSQSGGTTGGVVQATHTEAVSSSSATTPSVQATTNGNVGVTSEDSNPYLRGMRVNEVSTTAEPISTPIAPPATSTLPSNAGWATNPAMTSGSTTVSQPTPSRIP